MMLRAIAVGVGLCAWLLSRPASCDVQRFAVVVGNNHGQGDDVELRYAEADAERLASVLRDVGSFPPANIAVLRNEDSVMVRNTLVAFNERVRAAHAIPNTHTLLFIYYSGHSDAQALRMRNSRLEIAELARLVRGSPATLRLLVLDSCRSGVLTRSKGGKISPPFALAAEARLQGEGIAFLTASSADEAAQESDELRGSFFTHALVSAMLGAGDVDADGAVTLDEVYRHARDGTLRSTSRTFAGTQHPTFQFELRGQERLVITRPGAAAHDRAQLRFPKDLGFLVMAEREAGPVIAEVGPGDLGRNLSVKSGRYFVRGRANDALLEGFVDVAAGQTREVDLSRMRRVAYGRLVRKGEGDARAAHGTELGFAVRSALPNADGFCHGPMLGYRIDFEPISVGARFSGCASGFENVGIRARVNEYGISVYAERAWDFDAVTAAVSIGGGGVLTTQSFDTGGVAPSRHALSPFAFVGLGVRRDMGHRLYVAIDLRPEAHFIYFQNNAQMPPSLSVHLAARSTASMGLQF